MKKHVIALLLSIVLAASSIGTAPVLATETTAAEAISAQQEDSVERQEEFSEEIEDAESGTDTEESTEEATTVGESAQMSEELGQNTESSATETAEIAEEEENADEEDGSPDISASTEAEDVNEDRTGNLVNEVNTTADVAEIEETSVIEEETETAEENEALLDEAEEVDESGTCGEKATWSLKGTGRDLTLTISGSGKMYDYEDVTDHASPWYLNKGRIKRIIIEDGITSIGNYAFYNCGNLTSITIPDSVTRIGKWAFTECKSLADITIPDSVENIGQRAFSQCDSLLTVTIPGGVTSIERYAFFQCAGLTSITIPEGVIKIEDYAFYNCGSLTSLTISNSVTSIGENAFNSCYSLAEITIPDSVTFIADNAFYSWHLHADIYTTKGCTADLYFRSKDNGSTYIYIMHYPCEETGHKFDDWTITKPATCTEAGSKERACTACYEIEKEVIPATGHTWAKDYTVDREPTQTEAGSKSIHCTVCDAIDETTVSLIPKLGFSVDAEFVVEKPAFNYTGYPIEPGVTVTYNGDQLVNGKDYTVSYENNTNIGTATVYVNGIGEYSGTEQLQFRIRLGNTPKLHFTNVASGLKVSWQKVSGATRYKVYRNGDLIFTTSALVVTDKEVKYKGGTKFTYTVVATEKNTGDSELSKSDSYYRLMPVGIKSLTNPSSGKMTVTYDKSAGCYGYVIRYGLKSDMSDANVVTVQGENKTSRTFGGMKKGKKYYVQVRTYMLENGVRYYSAYCTTKTITIKK